MPVIESQIDPRSDEFKRNREGMLAAIDESTLLVPVSLVLFKSAYIQDAAAIVEKAHKVGARVVLDGVRRDAVVAAVAVSLRALRDQQLLALAEERARLMARLAVTAVEREAVGDASRLEVNLALAEQARSKGAALDARRVVDDPCGASRAVWAAAATT